MRGSTKIPGHSQLCQLYHHLRILSDSDLHYPSSRVVDMPSLVENDLRLETQVGPVLHWLLEIDPMHSHLGGHLPPARLVKSRRGTGPSSLSTLVNLAW